MSSAPALTVRGRAEPFLARDRNTLVKVAQPAPDPLMLIRRASVRSGGAR
jgi:hypothetical protein